MIRRLTFASLAALVVVLIAATGAAAATPTQIHEDALDGAIDGTFTLAELRAADRSVPTEQREYGGWEDAFNDALRRLQNPDSPPVVAPIDENRDGAIDEAERASAVEKTEKLKDTKNLRTAESRDPDNISKDDLDTDTPAASSDGSGDDEDGSLLIWLLLALPIGIVAFGAWRMYRQRSDEAANMDDDDA